jgi:hypothetical protein
MLVIFEEEKIKNLFVSSMYVLLEMTQKHNPCNTDNRNAQACSNSAEQITLWIFKVTKRHCQANNAQSFQDVLFISFSLHQREN